MHGAGFWAVPVPLPVIVSSGIDNWCRDKTFFPINAFNFR